MCRHLQACVHMRAPQWTLSTTFCVPACRAVKVQVTALENALAAAHSPRQHAQLQAQLGAARGELERLRPLVAAAGARIRALRAG